MSQVNDLVASGMTPVVPIANKFWSAGDILIILTALTAATGVFVACAVGASRVLYAMGREGSLPTLFGELYPRFRVLSARPAGSSELVIGPFYSLERRFWPHWS